MRKIINLLCHIMAFCTLTGAQEPTCTFVNTTRPYQLLPQGVCSKETALNIIRALQSRYDFGRADFQRLPMCSLPSDTLWFGDKADPLVTCGVSVFKGARYVPEEYFDEEGLVRVSWANSHWKYAYDPLLPDGAKTAQEVFGERMRVFLRSVTAQSRIFMEEKPVELVWRRHSGSNASANPEEICSDLVSRVIIRVESVVDFEPRQWTLLVDKFYVRRLVQLRSQELGRSVRPFELTLLSNYLFNSYANNFRPMIMDASAPVSVKLRDVVPLLKIEEYSLLDDGSIHPRPSPEEKDFYRIANSQGSSVTWWRYPNCAR